MAQNITLLGANYSAVPAVQLPKTGGGTARFDDTTDANAVASDILTGKTAYVNGQKITGTNSGGGGGASNLVTGTFKYSQVAASAQEITLDYSGTGYPIACIIVLDDGLRDETFTSTIAQNAIAQYFMTKTYADTTPTYSTSGDENQGAVASVYKSSTTNPATLSRTSTVGVNTYSSSNAANSTTTCVRFKSKTSMSIYASANSGTSRYGFLNGFQYRYWVIYSS